MEEEGTSGSQASKGPCLEGLSVLVVPERPALDIVFVHGFNGHPERTWAHKGGGMKDRHEQDDEEEEEEDARPAKFRKLLPSTSSYSKRQGVCKRVYWPRDLLPATMPRARVLTYGYDTRVKWLGSPISKNTVSDIAMNLLVSLEAERRSERSRPLLFIAHSLGGIVVKETLWKSRKYKTHQGHLYHIFEFTAGILFFGTPHSGADPRGLLQHVAQKIAEAAGFSTNKQIVDALLPSSERLRTLREDFGIMVRQEKWVIYSFQEQYGVKALGNNKVVDDTSSCLSDPVIEVTQHIAKNHMDMCRFGDSSDVEYRKVVAALSRVQEAIIESSTSRERSVPTVDQRQTILHSLMFDQIDKRQATIKTAHAKTCRWLLSNSEYLDWLDLNRISEHHGFLWIKGKPGTGKSTIMKFVCSHFKRAMTNTIIISFFFNARGESLEKSTIGMYRSLVFQLLEKAPDLQDVFDVLGSQTLNGEDSREWDIETLKDLFSCAIKKLGRRPLTCFIDALDECDEDQVRDMVTFFENLGHLTVSDRIPLYICFSSRHYPHISIGKAQHLILEGQEGHSQDIANYIHSELKVGRSNQADQLRTETLEKASGIFMWVILVVQILNKEYDRGRIHSLRKRLREIPAGLNELFRDILMRDKENMEDMLLCLQWILYAKRPLKREELYFAVIAGGLAEVAKSKDQTVQFIHESVRDYLLKGNGLSSLWPELGGDFLGLSHERLKQHCYTFLKVDIADFLLPWTIHELPAASSEEAANLRRLVSGRFPFLEYAVRNILYHADAAEGDGVPQNDFIENFPLRDWIFLDNLFKRYHIRRHTPDASLLYILAEENLAELIKIELCRVVHMDIIGERHHFPLFAALTNHKDNAVKALLIPDMGRQSNSDISHDLSCHCYQDLNAFLENGRDIKFGKGQTLLSYSAEHGDIPAVRVLLATGKVDIEARYGRHGWTPLSWAANNGHEVVVKLLLDTGKVEVDFKDNFGRTPLSQAAKNGHEAVVKLLLDTGKADVDSKNSNDRTPLWWAANDGHKAVVKLLLDTGKVEADLKDKFGRTPLSEAAKNGHEAAAKLLLDTGKADVDSKCSGGQTPLWWAANNGHEAIVKLLLDTGKADVDSKCSGGQTPLWQAANNGHEAVVKLLLDTGKVDVDSKDRYGWAPLCRAAFTGNEAVVKLLLGAGKADVDSKSGNDRTPLWWAANDGHKAVVKLLLDTGKVDVDSKCSDGQTPLWRAALTGNEAVAKLLLDTGKVDVDSKDSYGWTLLCRAALTGNEAVVKLLLDTGKVDVDSTDGCGQTPLSWAATRGHEAVVKLLLDTGKVDVSSRDWMGRTPLSLAAEKGNEAVVKLLLDTKDANSKHMGG
ncbi:MAG: hypothetical protein M1839_005287 [Geoglossum umbratile]|nr:MAG: hypothetical protein M1839_005287 [Geoglossum umbratile]